MEKQINKIYEDSKRIWIATEIKVLLKLLIIASKYFQKKTDLSQIRYMKLLRIEVDYFGLDLLRMDYVLLMVKRLPTTMKTGFITIIYEQAQ